MARLLGDFPLVVVLVVAIVIEKPGEKIDYEDEDEDDDEDDSEKAGDWPVIIGQLRLLDAALRWRPRISSVPPAPDTPARSAEFIRLRPAANPHVANMNQARPKPNELRAPNQKTVPRLPERRFQSAYGNGQIKGPECEASTA